MSKDKAKKLFSLGKMVFEVSILILELLSLFIIFVLIVVGAFLWMGEKIGWYTYRGTLFLSLFYGFYLFIYFIITREKHLSFLSKILFSILIMLFVFKYMPIVSINTTIPTKEISEEKIINAVELLAKLFFSFIGIYIVLIFVDRKWLKKFNDLVKSRLGL